MSDFARFKAACLDWQRKLGLQDWRLVIKYEKGAGSEGQFADVDYHTAGRNAVIMFYGKSDTTQPVERRARHELLHVFLADLLAIAAKRGADHHPDVVLEEHRLIERLLKVTDA